MKQSNLTTPRTMQECNFQAWGDPVDRPTPRHSVSYYKWAGWVAFSLFCVIFLSVRGA